MRKLIRKTVAIALTGSALGLVSTQASAFTSTSIGTYTGTALSVNGASGIRSYADYGTGVNYGWTHTPGWWNVQVGTVADITAGNTLNVQVKIAPNNTTATPMLNPGFSMWTSGTNPIVNGSGFHEWNQVRGPNDTYDFDNPGTPLATPVSTNNGLGSPGNIVNGHDGWIGTANGGPSFTNGDGDVVNHGALWNTASPYFNSGASGGAAGTAYSSTNFGLLNLFDLKAGYYLIKAGGSCPDDGPGYGGTTCGQQLGKNYTLTVSSVPVPAAVWLFGSALAGMGVIGRRKKKAFA